MMQQPSICDMNLANRGSLDIHQFQVVKTQLRIRNFRKYAWQQWKQESQSLRRNYIPLSHREFIIHQRVRSLEEEVLFIFVFLAQYLSHVKHSTHCEWSYLNLKESPLNLYSEPNYFYFINFCNLLDSTLRDK